MPPLITLENFIIQAKQIHITDNYDYKKMEKKDDGKYYITIFCKKHQLEFLQRKDQHIEGKGCPLCGKEKQSKSQSKTTNQIVKEFKNVHKDKYDYSKVEYKNNYTDVIIICKNHGEFKQAPNHHLNAGQGCPKCKGDNNSINQTMSQEEFVLKANNIHNNLYDYSKTEYKHNNIEIDIICKNHGLFKQLPRVHIYGKSGCPSCINYKSEKLCRKIMNLYTGYVFNKYKNRKWLDCLELDGYCDEIKLAFEYNGLQHYVRNLYFHPYEGLFEAQQKRDIKKVKLCQDNNVDLIVIPHNYSYKDETKLSSFIKDKLIQLNKYNPCKYYFNDIDLTFNDAYINCDTDGYNSSEKLGWKYVNEIVNPIKKFDDGTQIMLISSNIEENRLEQYITNLFETCGYDLKN